MKRYLILILLLITTKAFAVPDQLMSVTPQAVDATTITASDENTRNTNISTPYNAHGHADISSSTANTFSIGDGTAGNKQINVNNADSNKPFLRYDDTNNRWVESLDGTNITSLATVTGADASNFNFPGTVAQGEIFYINANSDVAMLTVGTSGQFLQTQGTERPIWADTTATVDVGTFSRDTSTATGSQAVTGVGFTPTLVIVAMTEDAADIYSIGFEDGTTGNVIFRRDDDSTFSSEVGGARLISKRTSGTTEYVGDLSSFDVDGFTIAWTKAGSPTGTIKMIYAAFR